MIHIDSSSFIHTHPPIRKMFSVCVYVCMCLLQAGLWSIILPLVLVVFVSLIGMVPYIALKSRDKRLDIRRAMNAQWNACVYPSEDPSIYHIIVII